MGNNLQVASATNQDPTTCVDSSCSCEIIWSLAQQFAMKHLVTHTPVHNHMPDYREGDPHVSSVQVENTTPAFVDDPEIRARRIAAAYARVFLEDFHLGDTSKIGRFYWLGLGAFASKQVAATLQLWRVKYLARWSALRKGLGRGNLWLFNDVLPWFYGYAAGAGNFDKCASIRNSREFVNQVSDNFIRQMDYGESIKKIPYKMDGETGSSKTELGYLQYTPLVGDGFSAVNQWEKAGSNAKPKIAFSHLLSIAKHEQGEVLQQLIYEDEEFQWWLNQQRAALATSDDTAINASLDAMQYGLSDGSDIGLSWVVRALVPNLQLVLTSSDATDDIEFRSDAPDRLVLQDYQKRMDWIQKAAAKYHGLMQGMRQKTMLGYLSEIRNWGDLSGTS